MKKDILLHVNIPEDVEISLAREGREIKAKHKDKEIVEVFILGKLKLELDGKKLLIKALKGTKREKKLAGTIRGKISNMIKGVIEGFTYKLQIASSHFPMRVEVDKTKGIITVKNYLGERIPRKAKILPDVEIKIENDIITVFSKRKEAAGQTAANIEKTTKAGSRDKRIFQDGIYLTEKPK
ncbi:MAG: 50S ribosomal protein L6 [Nanoarchaeota archaeon]|nr:50S ribosomal protein L6 [Nanoarchaeota archaeon]